MEWRKSTYSNANGGDCVEVAAEDVVRVRDTAHREGGMLGFTAAAWSMFLGGIRA